MATYNFIAGTTAPFIFQLLEAGSPIDLLGSTVTLLLADKNGTTVASPGTITINSTSNGEVQLAPASTSTFSAANGPYTARWKITEAGGNIYYVPTGPRDIWNITGA